MKEGMKNYGVSFFVQAASITMLILNMYILPEENKIDQSLETMILAFINTAVLSWQSRARKKESKGPPVAPAALALIASMMWSGVAHAEGLGRIELSQKQISIEHEQFDESGESTGFMRVETSSVSSLFFAPMVTLDLLVINLKNRNDYRAGVQPGICYGLHWSPSFYADGKSKDPESPLLSFGACLEGGIQVNSAESGGTTFASVSVLGVLQVLRWFNIGVGVQQLISLQDGVDDVTSPTIALGLNLATL